MQYHWDFSFLWASRHLLLVGLANTFMLALGSSLAGLLVGLVVGVGRTSPSRGLRALCGLYTEFFRNIPAIVLIFWFFYAIPVLTSWQASAWTASLAALTLYSGAYCAEIYRAGIESVEPGQWEAARALGFGRIRQLRCVILPQAMSRSIPAFTNRMIELLKTTTLASSLSLAETLYSAKLLAEAEYRPLEAYTAAAVMFIAIILPLAALSSRLERRLTSHRGHAA